MLNLADLVKRRITKAPELTNLLPDISVGPGTQTA